MELSDGYYWIKVTSDSDWELAEYVDDIDMGWGIRLEPLISLDVPFQIGPKVEAPE